MADHDTDEAEREARALAAWRRLLDAHLAGARCPACPRRRRRAATCRAVQLAEARLAS